MEARQPALTAFWATTSNKRSKRTTAPSDQSRRRPLREETMRSLSHQVLLAAVVLCLSRPVVAQSWPQRPVSVVVPQPAGTSPEVLCRVIADQLSRPLGPPFLPQHPPGAPNPVST